MIYKVFTIYDSKAGAFLQPFFMKTNGEAERAISNVLRDPEHNFTVHSDDFTLFELGSFDDVSAKFIQLDTPHSIGLLNQFKFK